MRKNYTPLFLIPLVFLSYSFSLSYCYDSGLVNGDPVSVFIDKEIFSSVKELIKRAKKSIDIEMYEFQDWEIADMLIKKSKENVKIRVIMDKSASGNKEIKKYLAQNGIDARYYPVKDKAINHLKVMIIDKYTGVITGANFGLHSVCNHDASIVFYNDAALHADKIFEDDWTYSTGMKAKPGDMKKNGKNQICDLRIITDEDIEKRAVELIAQSKKNIKMEMFALSDYRITKGLVSAKRRGVDVKVILDKSIDVNYKTAKYLRSNKIDVRWFLADDKTGQKMHMKLALFDGSSAFLGSANLSYHGLKINHECSIIILKKEIVKKLEAVFDNDLKAATNMPVGVLPEKGKR